MSESEAPDAGPMTRAEAAASIAAADNPPEAVDTVTEPEEIEGEASAPDDPTDEAETPPDGEEAEPEAVEPVDPPKYWSTDAKAQFAELPLELQAVVLAQEGPREEAAAKAKSDAAAISQTAQAEIGKVQQLADQLSGFLPQAIETFKNRWGVAPDWRAYAEEYGGEAMILAKVQHDDELGLLQQTYQASAQADATAREATLRVEWSTLAEIAPDLMDLEKGHERRTAITSYLKAEGLNPDDIDNITAREMRLAQKAMLWDQAQAALKVKPAAKPAPATATRNPVRPSAAVAQPMTPQREIDRLKNRFSQTRNRADAAELIHKLGL